MLGRCPPLNSPPPLTLHARLTTIKRTGDGTPTPKRSKATAITLGRWPCGGDVTGTVTYVVAKNVPCSAMRLAISS